MLVLWKSKTNHLHSALTLILQLTNSQKMELAEKQVVQAEELAEKTALMMTQQHSQLINTASCMQKTSGEISVLLLILLKIVKMRAVILNHNPRFHQNSQMKTK